MYRSRLLQFNRAINNPPSAGWVKNKIEYQVHGCTTQSDAEAEKEKELARIAKYASIDEPPTACCQSGCANCVFIVWAETVSKKLDNAGPEIVEKILERVEDPSMKAYLELELRIRGLKK
ncbi:uncharacterized protein isoform X2 [Choristoneura fumiferana]|uniref:uncharacterized protein isoform X2 n=1 Tax=Choristoneura fumiferana TaxID=7141 RepID=UPI003D15CB24